MDVQVLHKEVRYAFNQGEMDEMAKQMAEAVSQLEGFKEEFKEVKAKFKEGIAKAQNVIRSCASHIRTGWEYRIIECKVEKDFATNAVRVYRHDTGDLVEERAMTGEERQMALAPPMTNTSATAH